MKRGLRPHSKANLTFFVYEKTKKTFLLFNNKNGQPILGHDISHPDKRQSQEHITTMKRHINFDKYYS